ncbi:MAG: hypothetical protein FJ387_07855 [Verrucomicrobia bacterium]|nr:hypothetical protein [Verrucomicrobiota bacterium]
MTKPWAMSAALALLLGSPWARGQAADEAARANYQTGYRAARMLGLDLWKTLSEKEQRLVNSEPVSVVTDLAPFIELSDYPTEGKSLRFVFISVGFLDLVNNVAHAKAIDTLEPGYFARYVASLAQETGERELRPLPNVSDPKYWTEALLNEQISNFNQMVGVVVGISLSHHYLGRYQKYARQVDVPQGRQLPINEVLTNSEWENALRAGTRTALNAGLGVEGIKALFEAIDQMPTRPAWTAYFLPAKSRYRDARRILERTEKQFFSGF